MMVPVLDPEFAQVEATRLAGELREHKRAASYHKRAGRRTKMSLAQLQQMCDRAGIRLRVENDPHEDLKGGQGGDISSSTEGPHEGPAS